ncbi:non-ribosomal peptide synthetase [Rummeliibacillus suwonensis]|uniref:non-ribosomal peptide synthetase n=1 Tax=Rummeliibacillus suwonensis TaxID=1306154 RepID=UPI001644E2D5|nr:non-ribosomal peptide synthetase [Rummeliibacillus suwonensis]
MDNRITRDMTASNPNIVDLFELQVIKTPKEVAVKFEDNILTYSELDEKSALLARILSEKVDNNSYIGIYMERSLEMVVAILAVLKAGCAYVPLDPEYPKDRIIYMIKNTDVKVVLTKKFYLSELKSIKSEKLFVDNLQELNEPFYSKPFLPAKPSDPAYIIYTSGSTGNPKGVIIPHQAIVNHMVWMKKEFPLQEGESVLQKTPFSFDASVWEFYFPLLTGGILVMAPTGVQKNLRQIIECIQENSISVIQLVPPMLYLLIEDEEFKKCKTLKYVFCGGEVLPYTLKNKFYSIMDADLINLYGPSEACIDTTFHICKKDFETKTIPIGKAIDNVVLYVMDKNGRPVKEGKPGELWIGGMGLADGYINSPELTREKFVENPDSNSPYKKLYRTGDLVKQLKNGEIEYIDRIDNYVKVRGIFIDIGEIENTISKHKDILQSIVKVILIENIKFVVAYITLKKERNIGSNELRTYLKNGLPINMIPNYFVFMKEFPLSPSGKIDKRALPLPDLTKSVGTKPSSELTSIEKNIKSIFLETFNIEDIGIEDDFFELGGHSLLAIRILSRIKELYNKDIPIGLFFESPNIKSLSLEVQKLEESSVGENLYSQSRDKEIIDIDNLSEEEIDAMLNVYGREN